MANVLTSREQREISETARKVGGYSELIRIEQDLRKARSTGAAGVIERDAKSGRFNVVTSPRS